MEFLQAQTLAAAPSVAHGIALKRYSSACGRRDLRTEALISSDESGDSEAGSMVAQSSSNAVQSVKPALPAPPPGMDPLLFISSSKVLSFMAASCEDVTMDLFVQSPGPPRRRRHPALVTRRKTQVMCVHGNDLSGSHSFKFTAAAAQPIQAPLEMASDTVSCIYACLHALGMLCSYQDGIRCAIWTCAIQKKISRHVGHSLHGCISVPCFDHDPHFEHVQVSRYGAFSSDNRLESMNKKYKDGLSHEKVPLSSPSACLACRLKHAT